MKASKERIRLAVIIFLPLFLLLSIFIGGIYFLYQHQIDSIDTKIKTEALENSNAQDNAIEIHLPEILTDEDWETLSMKEIDQKLLSFGESEIGDSSDPFYELRPDEIEEWYDSFFYKISGGQDPDSLVFVDPDLSNKGNKSIPYISSQEIQDLESGLSRESLLSIILFIPLIGLCLGFFSWILAIRSMRPLELSLKNQKKFVENVSHELKTPLAMMKTEAEVFLKSKTVSKEETEIFAKNIIEDIDALNALSSQLLQFSILEKKNANPQKQEITTDWNRLHKKFQKRAKTENKKLEMEALQTPLEIKVPLIGLETLLQIIIDNAFKYTEEGDTIKVFVTQQKEKLLIEVIDSGKGIPKEDKDFIFDRFYRSDKVRNSQGFGLGLALAKESMHSINGDIQVVEKNLEGSHFLLTFPNHFS